ncbi:MULTISPECIES: TetR/AcrR family transcriptional regulator [unclassified Streptomyces]|uniref:TetR/AcrR family transcriptional regulator n=1 Tax=unclassified Streptomyces TaxID=2593676 RepID=UPI002E7770D7|nr:TetR/AcrR family transcriptional regulator [Streptomyces sp. JV190]MEE1838445.1 TetR/AcrR family transcriptional regulator [Streptomyces sp. JV190]
MSPKQQRGEATAEQVLDSALGIYAADGEAGLTVGAITRASGVSAGSVYHHFGSLQGVHNALALRCLGRLLDELVAELSRTTDARSGVQAIVRTYLAFVQARPDEARLLHSATADHESMAQAGRIRDSQEARLTPFALWARERREAGEITSLPAPVIEALVLGPVTAVARRWLSAGDVDMAEAARTLPDHIWRSISP